MTSDRLAAKHRAQHPVLEMITAEVKHKQNQIKQLIYLKYVRNLVQQLND